MLHTPNSKRGEAIASKQMATPTNKRDLIPKSTAKPSTRRVRRIGGAGAFADNPLFRPFGLDAPSPASRYRNSPLKSDHRLGRTAEKSTLFPIGDTLDEELAGTPELKIPSRYAASPNATAIGDIDTEFNDETINITFNTERVADRLKRTFGGSKQMCSPSKLASSRFNSNATTGRLFDDYNVTGTIFEESVELGKSRPSTAESSYAEHSDGRLSGDDSWQSGNMHISDIPDVTICFDNNPMRAKDPNIGSRLPPASKLDDKSSKAKAGLTFDIENMNTSLSQLSGSCDDDSLDAALAEQFANDCRIKTPPRLSPVSQLPSQTLQSPRKQIRLTSTSVSHTTDEFWNQSRAADFHDSNVPQKTARLLSPKKGTSPVKSKSAAEKAARADFEEKKQEIGQAFLEELDQTLTDGQLAKLSESTGGVSLVWSKTLNTTAGRANWKKQTDSASDAGESKFKHHASIELAEKVIDDECRLLNVIAHEFCHLANFMISGITNNPHGREFKAWAAKCTQQFKHRGIEVTTKHSYDIDFRYIWQCKECLCELKRHSRSITPGKHRCGRCKGELVQIKPTPRKAPAATSEYQLFLKAEMKVIRAENPGMAQKDVMKCAATRWAARSADSVEASAESSIGEDEAADTLPRMDDLVLDETDVAGDSASDNL